MIFPKKIPHIPLDPRKKIQPQLSADDGRSKPRCHVHGGRALQTGLEDGMRYQGDQVNMWFLLVT